MAKVLIVDDNESIRKMLGRRLKRAKYTVEIAENGQIGVEKALAGEFDIILMDMHMPVLEGLDAVKILRNEHEYKGIIIAVTASILQIEDAVKNGCDIGLSKPVGDDFESIIAKILEERGKK